MLTLSKGWALRKRAQGRHVKYWHANYLRKIDLKWMHKPHSDLCTHRQNMMHTFYLSFHLSFWGRGRVPFPLPKYHSPHQNLTACILKLLRVVLQGVELFDLNWKKAKTYYCCWLITYLEQLVILKSSVWSVCYIKIILFLQDSSKKGDRYTTDYRSTGGRGPPPPPRRRFGGFGGGGGGPAAPPCGTGGGWG